VKNNRPLIIAAVLIALLVLAGYFAYTKLNLPRPSTSTNNTQNESVLPKEEKSSAAEKFTGTFVDLVKQGQNYECMFENTNADESMTKGNVFVKAKSNKVRGDFVTTQKDGTGTNTYFISDGDYTYIWGSVMEKGIKTKMEQESESFLGNGSAENAQGSNFGLGDTDKVDFDCKPWNVNESKFTPPTSVEFIDLMMGR